MNEEKTLHVEQNLLSTMLSHEIIPTIGHVGDIKPANLRDIIHTTLDIKSEHVSKNS